jgi:hypothetical protein
MPRALWLFAIVLMLGLAARAQAHEVRPAYLELRQTGPETGDVLWKVPARAVTCSPPSRRPGQTIVTSRERRSGLPQVARPPNARRSAASAD